MGLLDFFRRRRERESAVAGLSASDDPSPRLSSMAVGDEVAAEPAPETDRQPSGGFDVAQLAQIGTLIAQAAKEGNIQVHQGEPHEIDLRETGQQIDASQMPDPQQQILDALQQHGVDVPSLDDAASIQIEHPGSDDHA